MSKELFVSSTPHETKVAIVEDDQLAEIYFERENEYTLAGSIYKGKVTRVLPGMQSAFVDLGLERDAFLYVTDFLEEQEDQEEFDQVVTQAHERAVKGDAPAQPAAEPRPAAAPEPERYERPERGPREPRAERPNFEERQPLSNAATIVEAGGDYVRPDVDGNRADDRGNREGGGRRWRGRRRRGRRGRGGMPQNKFADGQPDQQPPAAGEENAGREERGGRESGGQRFERGNRGEQRFERERGGREQRFDRGREERGREERGGRPSNYQPIVLPGESISKYRNLQPLPGESFGQAAAPEALPGESMARHPEQPAPHTGFAAQQEAVAAEADADSTQVQTVFTPPAGIEAEERDQERREEQRAGGFFDRVKAIFAGDESRPAVREHDERLNVAATFGGEEATSAAEPTSRNEIPYERPDLDEAREEREERGERRAARPAHGFGPGVVEEEEIDDEEMEALELGDDLESDDFEELEEETLEAEGGEEMVAAAEVTDAVRDVHVEERATGHYESEALDDDSEEDDGTDFEEVESGARDEAEMLAEGEEAADVEDAADAEEGAPDRAELRGPSGTLGFQQRSSEPTPGRSGERGSRRERFERGGRRGRRGRRVRGRRNIQSAGRPAINELLKEGQEILVQIAKEPMGKKGARITSHIALPGRFLVYMPTVAHIGVSRKIGSDEERQRLKRILLSEREETKAHGGFIVRTAAAGASEDDLRADIRFLVNLWNEIRQRAESSKAPALIYHDLNLVERILRDQVTQNFSHIWVDNEAEYERVLRFVGRFQPALVKRVKLYTKETPLFEAFNIQEEINKALKSKVWLKSGGYIVINQTEALVAIDVNTGKYVGKTGRLEDTIVKTNVDAIKEIVRQIRLRDLGGIIVIDFIDMDERRNRQKVMQALEEALRQDRAPSKVLQFNDFGLVAITRKRVKQSLERTLGQPCVYCTGTGLIKSVTTVCNEIYVEMRKMAKTMDKSDIMLRVNPEVGKQLKANGARWLSEMEELTGRTVIVKTDPTLHQEQFDIQ